MIQVVNKYKHKPTPNDIFIGRGSAFGNPYSHMSNTTALYRVDSRDIAVDKYETYVLSKIKNDSVFAKHIQELASRSRESDVNLVCYCAPARCHGEILKKIIETWIV